MRLDEIYVPADLHSTLSSVAVSQKVFGASSKLGDSYTRQKDAAMAIGWFTVLAAVPWKQVIENAPQVADGAKKLWNAVARKPVARDAAGSGTGLELTAEAPTLAGMASRIAAVEAETADLHRQMLASSELIKVLAEQNAQLVARIEANRVRVLWLSAILVVVSGLSLVSLVLAVTR